MGKLAFLTILVSFLWASHTIAQQPQEEFVPPAQKIIMVCPDCGRPGQDGQTNCYFDGHPLVEKILDQKPKEAQTEDSLERQKEQQQEQGLDERQRLEREIEQAVEEEQKRNSSEEDFLLIGDPEFINDDVESFYSAHGFHLFPQSRRLTWRNLFRTSLYYNDNIFVVNDQVEADSDFVASIDFETQIQYKKSRNLEISISAGAQYGHYMGEGLDEFLPRAALGVRYRRGMFYFIFNEQAAYSNVLISGEINDFSSSWRHEIEGTVGMVYKRWLFEMATFHQYQNFSDIEGDNHFYGQDYTFGYKVSSDIYLTMIYGWDIIEYFEDAGELGDELEGSNSHSGLAGIRLNRLVGISKNLGLTVAAGAQYRDGDLFLIWKINLDWKALEFDTRRWKVDLALSQRTKPSLIGDFREEIAGTLTVKYLFTPRLAGIGKASVIYTDPQAGESAIIYSPSVIGTYRLYKGIDIEAFLRADLVTSREETQESQRFLSGVSLLIIF